MQWGIRQELAQEAVAAVNSVSPTNTSRVSFFGGGPSVPTTTPAGKPNPYPALKYAHDKLQACVVAYQEPTFHFHWKSRFIISISKLSSSSAYR